MKKDREQDSANRNQDLDRMMRAVRNALSPLGDEVELDRDLWSSMLERINRESARSAARVPWFDWALAGGLLAFAAVVPRTIPVILYYL